MGDALGLPVRRGQGVATRVLRGRRVVGSIDGGGSRVQRDTVCSWYTRDGPVNLLTPSKHRIESVSLDIPLGFSF